MSQTSSTHAAAEVNRINTFFPLMPALGNRWAAQRPWEGLRVVLNMHLTTLTAALVRELALGGGEWVVCACNTATTDMAVVNLLREQGVHVHTGGDLRNRHVAALEHDPHLVADVGFELFETMFKRGGPGESLRAGVEITRTGINRLRAHGDLPIGVINVNDGALKPHIENRHGAGEALWMAVRGITGLHLAGRRVAVIGYGPVGQGVAAYAKAAGASVAVVERNTIRRLRAHYDGYPTPALPYALQRAELAVTATGRPDAIPVAALREVTTDLILVNAGHGGDEIDVAGLVEGAASGTQIGETCTRYRLPQGPVLTVLGNGHPLNIVTNSGSPEPVLIHFAVTGLTLEWLVRAELAAGEHVVPLEVEQQAAELALKALKAG